MADNAVLPATGLTVATDDVGGVQFQKFKLDIGGDGVSTPLSADNPVPVGISGDVVDYYPTYGSAADMTGTVARATFDPDLNLRTRSAVLTDEGTFRVNFANASLSLAIGTVTIAGNIVTGTGFDTVDIHKGDYFKLDAGAATSWVIVDSVDSDTQLTLLSTYSGGSSGAASRTLMRPTIGTGGSITVASGQCTIASGTTASAVTKIDRDIDVAPLVFRSRFNISQRIANHTTRAGMTEASSDTDRWFARFVFDGTTASLAKCETGRNPSTTPSASETETTTFTLPNNKNTSIMADYRVEVLTESVRFYVDGVLVAEHTKVIPAQHDPMDCLIASINGATPPATNTNIVVDYVTGKNHNKLEIGVMSDAEKIVAVQPPIVPIVFTQAGVIAINTDLLIIDCSQYRGLQIQCTSVGTTGVITPSWSNDGVTFVNTPISPVAGGGASATFNAAGMWTTDCLGKFFRLRLTTATTAGTTTLNVSGLQAVVGPKINQPISGTVGVTGYPTAAASADGLTNPTVTQVGAANLLFNGATWDRQRGNSTIATGDTGAKTATFNGATQTNHNACGAYITVAVGAVTGTTPTLACQLQISYDGTNFFNLGPASTNITTSTQTCTFAVYPTNISQTAGATPVNLTTGANQTIAINAPLPRTWRIVYTIGGSTPSFTLTNAYAAYIL